MITRIEIDGFKTFEKFHLALQPFTAIVGPNASGKSNLFDALRFLSLLAQTDIRSAMVDLRGEPEELFRRTDTGTSEEITIAVEVLLDRAGSDSFGTEFEILAQRLRYELTLQLHRGSRHLPRGIYVVSEYCGGIAKKNDEPRVISMFNPSYSYRKNPFIEMRGSKRSDQSTILIRQDGKTGQATKRGRPISLPAIGASRTALSTISTAEFPHLYALKSMLSSMQFLEINPLSARQPNDRFESRMLRPDASNLAAVLASFKAEREYSELSFDTLSDISFDLSSLIPSVSSVEGYDEVDRKDVSFGITTRDGSSFSSRVISDGTIRLIALLAVLNDPNRRGILCFEEPENGVHEGRISSLVELLRNSASSVADDTGTSNFQVLINTHSPAVMAALFDEEIAAADTVTVVSPSSKSKVTRTRIRTGVRTQLNLNPETNLTRGEIELLLRRPSEAA